MGLPQKHEGVVLLSIHNKSCTIYYSKITPFKSMFPVFKIYFRKKLDEKDSLWHKLQDLVVCTFRCYINQMRAYRWISWKRYFVCSINDLERRPTNVENEWVETAMCKKRKFTKVRFYFAWKEMCSQFYTQGSYIFLFCYLLSSKC